jgi:hypothetical protein
MASRMLLSCALRTRIENRQPSIAGVQVQDSEHLHAVFGDGVFIPNNGDVPKPECLDQDLDHLTMRNWPVAVPGGVRTTADCSLAILPA